MLKKNLICAFAASLGAICDTSRGTAKVGSYAPNAYGLYDMLGNVFEWCLDWFSTGMDYSDGSPVVDPKGVTTPSAYNRVSRGGCYGYAPTECRAACRAQGSDENSWEDIWGFRFSCPAIAK